MLPDIWEDYEQVIPGDEYAPNAAQEPYFDDDSTPFDTPPRGWDKEYGLSPITSVEQAQPVTTQSITDSAEQGVTPLDERDKAREWIRRQSITAMMEEPLSAEEQAQLDAMMRPYEEQLERNRLERQRREDLRQIIEPYILSANDRLPELKPVIAHKGVIIGSEGNISAVVGEAKSKKTFFCTAVVGSLTDLCNNRRFGIEHRLCKVLWVDTEQSREHIQKVLFRINLLSSLEIDRQNPLILTQTLREEKPSDRLALMEYAIQYFQPKLVVVDGISDLMTNTNALEESEALVARLLTLSTQHKCHIMNVLHTNPNSDKARGHLGSTLMRKAETVIFVHRTGEKSVVEPQYCRNEPFERFAFQVVNASDELCRKYPRAQGLGLPEECELPKTEADKEDDCVRILREEFGGCAERKLLCYKLEEKLGITINYAKVKVLRAIERGCILCEDSVVSLP